MTMKLTRSMIGITVFLWLLLGLGYPLAMTGLGELLFPYQAGGSPVVVQGRTVASRHVGQFFDQNQYFWGRPSATVSVATGRPEPYNPFNSAPSNRGPTNEALAAAVKARIDHLLAATPGLTVGQIPIDLVEGSGSGLDPDISPSAALIQIPRISRATGLSPAFLRQLVTESIQEPQFGVLGRARVNVTELNIRLYQILHGHAPVD